MIGQIPSSSLGHCAFSRSDCYSGSLVFLSLIDARPFLSDRSEPPENTQLNSISFFRRRLLLLLYFTFKASTLQIN